MTQGVFTKSEYSFRSTDHILYSVMLKASLYLLCINIQVELIIEKVQEAGKKYERLIKANTEREKRRVEMIKERHEDLEQHIETVKTTADDVSIYMKYEPESGT